MSCSIFSVCVLFLVTDGQKLWCPDWCFFSWRLMGMPWAIDPQIFKQFRWKLTELCYGLFLALLFLAKIKSRNLSILMIASVSKHICYKDIWRYHACILSSYWVIKVYVISVRMAEPQTAKIQSRNFPCLMCGMPLKHICYKCKWWYFARIQYIYRVTILLSL